MQTIAHSGMYTRQGVTARPIASTSARAAPALPVYRRCVIARATDEDIELEKRLEKLRASKGATPYGQGVKSEKKRGPEASGSTSTSAATSGPAPVYDYTGETVYYEGPPHRGDLALNLALGTTLLWLPLTIAAIGRTAFVNYRFTDKRLSVKATAPWKNEQTDVAYQEVKDVVTVGRAFGAWGDMVVTLRNGDKVEIRSLDRYTELKEYVLKRRDALAPAAGAPTSTGRARGANVTAAELLGEEPAPVKKGF